MVLTRKKEIAAISTPLVFPGSDNSVWQSLSAFCYEGMHYLTVAGPDGRRVSTSRDLRRWQELRPLSEEDLSRLDSAKGEQISPVCSIVWDEELDLYVKYELEAPGGRICLAVSRDRKHWQNFERDRATAPERGRCVRRRLLQGAALWGIYLSGEPAIRCSCV